MEQVAQLFALLASQPAPELNLNPISGLAQILQTYGAWGLVAILMVVVYFLFRRLEAARDSKDGTLEAQVKGSTELVEEQTKASVELKNALVNVTEALKAMERRLENVEKKLG